METSQTLNNSNDTSSPSLLTNMMPSTLVELAEYGKIYLPTSLFIINYCLIPLIICLGILVTILSINVFLHSRVKSLIYKYLLFNSIFDMITLCIAFLNTCTSLFNKNDEFIKYAKYVEIYLFVYVSSVSLTCSNLTKCALAFDRIFKLKGKCKCLTGKRSFKWTMSSVVLFSLLANFPILIGHRFFIIHDKSSSFSIIRPSIAFMSLKERLNNNNNNTDDINSPSSLSNLNTYGRFFAINALVLDMATFLSVCLTDILLIIVIRLSLKKIAKFQARNKNSRQKIEFEIVNDNEDEYDQVPDVRIRANLNSESVSIESQTRTPNNVLQHRTSRDSSRKNHNTDSDVATSKNIELAYKCSLSKMIQLYCLVFMFGHVLFSITGLLIQTQHFSSKHNFSNEKHPHLLFPLRRETLDLLVSLSLLFLYLSFSGNFLVYYQYNSLFRVVLTGDEDQNNDRNIGGNIGGSIGGGGINGQAINGVCAINGINEMETVFLPD